MENNNTWNETQKSFDDYVENLINPNFQIEHENSLTINKNGMIPLDNNIELRQHAIILGNKLIFPHSFLRRFGNSNFVNINTVLANLEKKGTNVFIRLDPFKVSDLANYQEIIERDIYYGPKFSNDILERELNFCPSVHWTNFEDNSDPNNLIQLMTYPVNYTIFRPSWLDKEQNIVQYYIEELMISLSNYKYKNDRFPPYSSKRYVAQKFVHFTFDRNNKYFEHIDGSVRIFDVKKYENLYNNFVCTGVIYPQHIEGVQRYKLFKVQGKLNYEDISNILREYLMYNPHIAEYFDK